MNVAATVLSLHELPVSELRVGDTLLDCDYNPLGEIVSLTAAETFEFDGFEVVTAIAATLTTGDVVRMTTTGSITDYVAILREGAE